MTVEVVKSGRPYRVCILGGGYEYIKLLHEAGFSGAKSPEEADFVLFTGGEDVDPTFYDETALKTTFFNTMRDRREKVVYDFCVEKKIPMVGICRGGQFLNVMNGGKLWQHVDGHATGRTHAIAAEGKDKPILVTSTHHQQMIPTRKAKVLAVGINGNGEPICKEKFSFGKEVAGNMKKNPDFEVVFYPETNSLCFQPHPEFPHAPQECKEYFDELLENHILPVA